MSTNLDPVTLTVIQNGLIQVCNEMDLAFVRSAFSPVIAEGMDRSDGIYDAIDGSLIAQGELGLPVFVGTMQFSTARGDRPGEEPLRQHASMPGDVFIVNDPYLGGTHLMDVRFVKPFFYRGELFAWLANTGHWPDIGGMVPGGFSASATEVEQEGLRLPPVKLFKKGVMDQEILRHPDRNIRIADQRIGDIKAQAAALTTGEQRLTALIDRYGAARGQAGDRRDAPSRRAADARQDRGDPRRRLRRAPRTVDSDGVVDEPLTIAMKITKKGEDLTFDLTGSSPPCRGPMNSVIATTKSAIYLAIKHIFPEVPINAGTFEPLHIVEPEGTFLYAQYPRPVSGCAAEVSQRIAEAVFAALAKAIPDLLFAAPAGTRAISALGGYDPERKRNYVMYLFTGGGYGGFQGGDGLTNGCSTIGISKMPPVEVLEQFYPILFEEFSLREGSGGAGEYRGGFGINYAIKLRRGEARVSMVMDHGRTGPQGVLGGDAGGVNTVQVTQGGKTYRAAASLQGPGHRDRRRRRGARCRRRAAAASAIRRSASPRRSPATLRAATTPRRKRARSSARGRLHDRSVAGGAPLQWRVMFRSAHDAPLEWRAPSRRLLVAMPMLAMPVARRRSERLEIPPRGTSCSRGNAFTVEMPGMPDHQA